MNRLVWKILLVDDDRDDYLLTRSNLAELQPVHVELRWAPGYAEGLQALSEDAYDAVLVDYHLGRQDGLKFIREASQAGHQLPFILLTAQNSYELDFAAMQSGAADFLTKGETNARLLERSLRYAIERHRLQEDYRQQKELFRTVFEVNPDGLAIVAGPGHTFHVANAAYRKLTPHPEIDPVGRTIDEVWTPSDVFHGSDAIQYVLDTQQPVRVDRYSFTYPDGSQRTLAFHLQAHTWQGQPAVLIILWEITALEEARDRAEEAALEAGRRAAEAEEARRILQAIMDHLPETLVIAEGPDVRLCMISKHGEWVSGLREELLLGRSLEEYAPLLPIYARDGRTPLLPEAFPLSRAARGEIVMNEEITLRAADGRLVTLSCNAAPIKDAQGVITGSLTTMIDITESQRMANALRMSEARFRSIFDANVIPLAMWNTDGRILEANNAYLQLVGYSQQELQEGKLRWTDLTLPEYRERDEQAIEEMAVGRPATPYEKEYLLRNNRRVPVLIGGAMISDYGDRGWLFAVDLTERKQAEERLAYHARLLENVHDAIIATDEDFMITAWNHAAEELYGWSAGEVIGRRLSDVVRTEITSALFQDALDLLAERGAYRLEIAQYTRDQRKLLIESSMITLRDSSGHITGYVSANRDATARIQASAEREELLRRLEQQQAQLSAVINNAPVGILVTDPEARILLANPAGERLIARPIPYGLHYSAHACFEMHDLEGNPYEPRNLPLTRSALDGERFENLEVQVRWPDGQQREWLVNSAPILGPGGEIEGAVVIFQDITERRRAAEELQRNAARIEIQRYLSRAREQERLNIAHDLHDGPLQEMIGLSFALSETLSLIEEAKLEAEGSAENNFASDLSTADRMPVTGSGLEAREEDLLRQLNGMQEQVQRLIREMRAFCNELRPPALTPFGLERAIFSHADTFRSLHPDIDLSLDLERDGQALPESIRGTLFQVYRESLNNILKHAQATEVSIQFGLEEGSAILQVRDNGRGFQVPDLWVEFARQGHLGLVGIQERAELVGGYVQLSSAPGRGTTLRVTVPYEDSPPPALEGQ